MAIIWLISAERCLLCADRLSQMLKLVNAFVGGWFSNNETVFVEVRPY